MPDYIDWDESVRVFIKDFDDAHAELVKLANDVIRAASEEHNPLVFLENIDTLIAHTEEHFQREERLMEMTQFSMLTEHRNHHLALLESIRNIRKRAEEGSGNVEGLMRYLTDWLYIHICEYDQKYTDYFHSIGIN